MNTLKNRNLQANTLEPINYSKFFNTPRDQKDCGSCWAFSATGALEGVIGKSLGKPIPYLSPQQLVDCDKKNDGCDGGFPQDAYASYVLNVGLMDDTDYPYKAKDKTCAYKPGKKVTKVTGNKWCSNYKSKKCTTNIFYALLQQGPLAVGIDGAAIEMYESGIFKGKCPDDNHAVVAIGYGTEKGVNYWLVRNSYGANWGEKGNIRVSTLSSNHACFVENEGVLPLI